MLCIMCICPAIFSVVDPRHTALSLCFYPSVGDVTSTEARGNGIPPESSCNYPSDRIGRGCKPTQGRGLEYGFISETKAYEHCFGVSQSQGLESGSFRTVLPEWEVSRMF